MHPDNIGQQFTQYPLYHGTDASLKVGDIVRPGSWGTYSKNVAGYHGVNVYHVTPVDSKDDPSIGENNSGMRVIKPVNNPHYDGSCGRKECEEEIIDHGSYTDPTTGHELDK